MRKLMWTIVALLVICFSPGTLRADSITVTVGGTEYFVTTITGTFADNMTQLESTPWWGNQTLAKDIATAVADDIGTPNNGGDGGPLFAYSGDAFNAYMFLMGNVIQETNVPDILSFSFGVGNVVTTPEPSSLALIPIGLGALLVMRRRIGQDSPSAV